MWILYDKKAEAFFSVLGKLDGEKVNILNRSVHIIVEYFSAEKTRYMIFRKSQI